ncbi:piggyBac transposable element-derived protein 4-like [Maniola jurtina]|uniref:piggyBac transposable element-derived protein 4-like n=1 Tax=Maniola jurtina TaxID=191418 RepID=UPI001E68C59A|nr:piggyBac transposable element-derived protein 4-like [Maniola jurtina]XP_045775526.1 piggyBac transposable element-derived protein 4-like [Maniola jurtina]
MASRQPLNPDEIALILEQDEDYSPQDTDSEEEDCVSEDDVRSDFEDDVVDVIENTTPEDRLEEPEQTDPSSESHQLEVTPSSSRRIITLSQRSIRGKNNNIWATVKGRSTGRTSAINIVRINRGPARMCRNIVDPLLCFQLFIKDEIVEEIVKWTNVEMVRKRENLKEISASYRDTTETEIWALIGILTLTAVMKDNHLSAGELFNASFSGSRYVSVMSRERFEFLLRSLRMDDKSLRATHRQEDAFIPIRKIWEIFINQCRLNYIPGTHLTVDEQLLGFRGRCPFRMYIPNKPDKYGIKFPMICDASTKYMIDAIPYLGKSTKTNGLPLGEFYVKELTKTVHGSNRNITCDNWFTSVPLAKSLLKAPYNLTLVGTIRSNKREIPEEIKNSRSRPVGSSMFCFDGPLTLVSYKPKPSKMVYCLSSCDEDAVINQNNGKPDMILFYNQTKGGVDSFDQMCSSMSSKRKTNRWPMAVFYGMLNMAFVNSYVIYCHNKLAKKEKPLNRKDFMKKLSTELTTPWMQKRLEAPTLKRTLRESIASILNTEAQPITQSSSGEPEPKKRRYCGFCYYKKKRMTKTQCSKCKKPICGEHNIDICRDCV